MKTKKTNKKSLNVTIIPEWKYKMILARIDKQDKIIAQLCSDIDDFTSRLRFYRYICDRVECRINRLSELLRK